MATAYGLTVIVHDETRVPNALTGEQQTRVTFTANDSTEWVYTSRIRTECLWFPIMVEVTRDDVRDHPGFYAGRNLTVGDTYEWGAETTYERAERFADDLGGWVGTPYAMHADGEECDCY